MTGVHLPSMPGKEGIVLTSLPLSFALFLPKSMVTPYIVHIVFMPGALLHAPKMNAPCGARLPKLCPPKGGIVSPYRFTSPPLYRLHVFVYFCAPLLWPFFGGFASRSFACVLVFWLFEWLIVLLIVCPFVSLFLSVLRRRTANHARTTRCGPFARASGG